MSIDLNVQIDALYNPANIRDRAMQTYEIMRKRTRLLTDYDGKLDKILEIVEENKNKHILVINKFGEFAAKVTKFLNDMSANEICGDYHDRVEPVPARTIDGFPIYVKSGANKGERKMFAAKAQKTYNEARLLSHDDLITNLGYIDSFSGKLVVELVARPLESRVLSPFIETICLFIYIKKSHLKLHTLMQL